MKKCPFCAEEIQDEAIICKHCGKRVVKAEIDPRLEQIKAFWEKPSYKNRYRGEFTEDGKLIIWANATEMNVGVLILLIIFFVIPGIIYAIVKANPRDKKVYTFEVRADGAVYRDGTKLEDKKINKLYPLPKK